MTLGHGSSVKHVSVSRVTEPWLPLPCWKWPLSVRAGPSPILHLVLDPYFPPPPRPQAFAPVSHLASPLLSRSCSLRSSIFFSSPCFHALFRCWRLSPNHPPLCLLCYTKATGAECGGRLAACGVGLEPQVFMTKLLDLSLLRFDQQGTRAEEPPAARQRVHQSLSRSRPSGARFVCVSVKQMSAWLFPGYRFFFPLSYHEQPYGENVAGPYRGSC